MEVLVRPAARDGRGRVRREQGLPLPGPMMLDAEVRMITISDPRERTVYLLDPRRRTVSKSAVPTGFPRRHGEAPCWNTCRATVWRTIPGTTQDKLWLGGAGD
jgi:hypothetical protein